MEEEKKGNCDFQLSWIGVEDPTEIKDDISMVKWAEKFAQYIAEKDQAKDSEPVTTNQLRKFFGEVRRIQLLSIGEKTKTQESLNGIEMLMPRLAYDVGRQKGKNKIDDLKYQLDIPLKKLAEGQGDFNRFVMVLEAIVAYHKLYYKEKNT